MAVQFVDQINIHVDGQAMAHLFMQIMYLEQLEKLDTNLDVQLVADGQIEEELHHLTAVLAHCFHIIMAQVAQTILGWLGLIQVVAALAQQHKVVVAYANVAVAAVTV